MTIYEEGMTMTSEYMQFKTWIQSEVVIFCALIAGNVVYMLVRSCKKQETGFYPVKEYDRQGQPFQVEVS